MNFPLPITNNQFSPTQKRKAMTTKLYIKYSNSGKSKYIRHFVCENGQSFHFFQKDYTEPGSFQHLAKTEEEIERESTQDEIDFFNETKKRVDKSKFLMENLPLNKKLTAIDKLISKLEHYSFEKEKINFEPFAIQEIEKLFQNKIKVFFSGIECWIIIINHNQTHSVRSDKPVYLPVIAEEVGDDYYGLEPYIAGESQGSCLRALLENTLDYVYPEDLLFQILHEIYDNIFNITNLNINYSVFVQFYPFIDELDINVDDIRDYIYKHSEDLRVIIENRDFDLAKCPSFLLIAFLIDIFPSTMKEKWPISAEIRQKAFTLLNHAEEF